MKPAPQQTSADGRVEFDAAGVPVAFQVFHAGANSFSKDGVSYTLNLSDADLQTIADNFERKGNLIPVDAKHLFAEVGDAVKMDEDELAKKNPLLFSELANGMLSLQKRGAALWANVEKWSADVRKIFSGQRTFVPYFSPVVRPVNIANGALEISDRAALRMTSLTLTCEPALNKLPSLALCDRAGENDFAFAVLKLTEPASTKQKTGVRMKKYLERLGALLGLSGDSLKLSDTEINTTAETVMQKAADKIEGLQNAASQFIASAKGSLKLTGEQTLDTIAAAIGQLATNAGGSALQLTEVTSRLRVLEGNEHGRLVESLLREGKLTEAMKPWAVGQTSLQLTEWAKHAPVIVQPGQSVQGNGEAPAAPGSLMMTEQDFSASQNAFGKSPKEKLENFAKANGLKIPAAMLARVAVMLLAVVFGFMSVVPAARATAATGPVDTAVRAGDIIAPVASSNVLYAGHIACLNSSGVAVDGADSSGYKAIGIFAETVDNTGANYSATKTVKVRRGVFGFTTGSTNTVNDIGAMAYILDNVTVGNASEASQDIMAGVIVDVQSAKTRLDATNSTTIVWVDMLSVGRQGAASFTTVSASSTATLSGNATVGGTLGVTGNTTLSANATVSSNLAVTGASTFTGVATLNGSNTVFGSSMVGGSITQLTVSAYLKVQGPGGTNYYIKAYLPTGP